MKKINRNKCNECKYDYSPYYPFIIYDNHESEYTTSLEAIIKEGVENEYDIYEIVLAVKRLNQRLWGLKPQKGEI